MRASLWVDSLCARVFVRHNWATKRRHVYSSVTQVISDERILGLLTQLSNTLVLRSFVHVVLIITFAMSDGKTPKESEKTSERKGKWKRGNCKTSCKQSLEENWKEKLWRIFTIGIVVLERPLAIQMCTSPSTSILMNNSGKQEANSDDEERREKWKKVEEEMPK